MIPVRKKKRYEGCWRNVDEECLLCEMEKRTEWHIETPEFVVADTLSGSPFIVSKVHGVKKGEQTDKRFEDARRLVSLLYDNFELVVKMNMCPNHWHGHIVTKDEKSDLDSE
jgi:hypothetical protein